MNVLSAFFTSFFHVLALAWATIHPSVNPHQHPMGLVTIAREVRVGYREHRPATRVYAASRAADSGYWHTSGNLILNERGDAVRIQGINWYGFETIRKVPGGMAVQDYRAILETIRSEGFNTIRIPLSNDMVEHPVVPEAISFTNDRGAAINQDLRGLNSLEILDRVIDQAGTLGLKVILDNHRSEAGDSAEGSGLWYTAQYPESSWVADWQMLARRYSGNTTVIGMDLRNEPHNAASGGACWTGCGASHDWHLAAQRGGNAVLAINPRLLVFVEGTDAVNGDFYWWGGNLEGVRQAPVRLNVANHLVYSAHEYGPKEYHQKWFDGASAASLEAVFDRHWGFVSRQGIAPVWIGEFGTSNRSQDISEGASGTEGQWFQSLVSYFGRNREVNWTSWALNGEDSDGLLNAEYAAPSNSLKMAALNRIMTGAAQQAIMPMQNVAVNVPVTIYPQLYGQTGVAAHSNMTLAYIPHLPASVLRPRTRPGLYDESIENQSHQQQVAPHQQQTRLAEADGF